MDCCPMCGQTGTERSREAIIKNGKLVDRVVMSCYHPTHGRGSYFRYEPLTDYDKKKDRQRMVVQSEEGQVQLLHKVISSSDGNVAQVAREADIPLSTVWAYVKKYPELKDLVEERRKLSKQKRKSRYRPRTSRAVTPLMERLVETTDRAQKDKRRERMLKKVREFGS